MFFFFTSSFGIKIMLISFKELEKAVSLKKIVLIKAGGARFILERERGREKEHEGREGQR